ncbi:hypothetical protein [Flavobacterium sp. IB48]|uniref:hypothetical protein n=1 Tax=Flavobacterium sp. IB48 TaxID=2779375 RepID=UPI0018E7EBF2|nr:hypothetical protein [Flavobacterium sp. IB48]MBJ2126701.1 hypothetical protein [Flavobacterium sp. IB48]
MKKTVTLLALSVCLFSCSEKIYLYKAKITSIDVNGTDKFGPKNAPRVSKAIEDPLEPKNLLDNMGVLVDKDNLRGKNNLVNHIFLSGDYGDIDKIYLDYLTESVLPNYVPTADIMSETQWIVFVNNFNNRFGYEKKQYLFLPEHAGIRKELEKQIVDIHPVEVQQEHKLKQLFKSKLEANVKSVLETQGSISGEIKAQIESLVKNEVDLEGKYYDIEFNPFFTGKLVELFTGYQKTPPRKNTNLFTKNYHNYYANNKAYLADGYGVLVLTIKYDVSKISKTDIETIINADANLSATQKADLSAKVFASFSLEKNFTGQASSTKNYLVKYQYNNQVESLRPDARALTLLEIMEQAAN